MNRSLSLILIIILIAAKSLLAQPPAIIYITPERGPLGAPFTIGGSNFDPNYLNNIVYLGATRATVTGGSTTQLNVLSRVSSHQPITVTANGLTAYSARPYLPLLPGPPFGPNSLKGRVDIANVGVHALVAQDFDDDNKVDLAIVGWNVLGLKILKNNSTIGNPIFSDALNKPGVAASGLCTGDLNGDGKPDVVTANYGNDNISIYINNSTNNNIAFFDAVTYPTGRNPYRVAIGDFNNDGKPDIVVTNESSLANSISVFENDTPLGGPTWFKLGKNFPTQPTPRGVEVGDIDMDGKADIIVACQSGYLSVFKNTSALNTINFAAAININLPSGSSPESSVIADFDHDLKSDIAVANNGSNNLSVLKNTSSPGTISFATRQDFATGQTNFNSSVGDFNLDGKPDVVVTNQGDNSTSVLINKSAPNSISFENKFDFSVGRQPRSSAIVDVDGDFKPDLIVGNNDESTVSILLSNTQKTQAVINFPPPLQAQIGPDNILKPDATSNNTETPIVYTSSNPNVAYIRADGQIEVIGPGTTTITASQPESANYLAATPVSRPYDIRQYQSISFPALSSKSICDADFSVNASSITPQPLFYSSSNPLIATISATGIIHIVGAGTTTITITQPGNSLYYDAAPVSQVLKIDLPIQPTVKIAANPTCAGSPVIFIATALNAGAAPSYQWFINASPTGTNSSQLIVSNILATDVVRCKLTSNATCATGPIFSNNLSVAVQPSVTPSITIQTADGPRCAGSTIAFTATALNVGSNAMYEWRVNNIPVATTNQPTFSKSNFVNGDRVTCVISDNTTPCLTTTTALSNEITVPITLPVQPDVTVTASANNVSGGTLITFTATSQISIASYQWAVNGINQGDNTSTFATNELKSGDKVTCTVMAAGGCVVPGVSEAIIMTIIQPTDIKISNAFTPNGDGINDTWEISDLVFFPDCIVKIFNRNGVLLYQSTGYSKPWDGAFNGKKVTSGTYYYLIKLHPSATSPRSGYVSIIN